MIFQHTWQWIVDKSPHTGQPKTSTARLVKPRERIIHFDVSGWPIERPFVEVYGPDRAFPRLKWQVGRDYAIQPGRGKPAIARLVIDRIRRTNVLFENDTFCRREGFRDIDHFRKLWCDMHGNNYDAWIIEFHLLESP